MDEHNLDDDVGDRIVAMLAERRFRDDYIGAARTAGKQLEWLCSASAFVTSIGDMPSSSTALMVVADARRVVGIGLAKPPGADRQRLFDNLVRPTRELVAAKGWQLRDLDVLGAMQRLVKGYGARPGKPPPEKIPGYADALIATMWAALPDPALRDAVASLDHFLTMGVRPGVVGLLGKPDKDGQAMVWPLILPLARFELPQPEWVRAKN